MPINRTWSRRGALLAVKRCLLGGLADELALQHAANQSDEEAEAGKPSLVGLPEPEAPLSISIAPQGVFDFNTLEMPAIRIVGLPGSRLQQMGIEPACLGGWPIGIYVHLRNTEADPDRGLNAEEVTDLLIETVMDAVRLTLHKDGGVGVYDFYGIYGLSYLGQVVDYLHFNNNHHATELIGEQVWLVQQTVMT